MKVEPQPTELAETVEATLIAEIIIGDIWNEVLKAAKPEPDVIQL